MNRIRPDGTPSIGFADWSRTCEHNLSLTVDPEDATQLQLVYMHYARGSHPSNLRLRQLARVVVCGIELLNTGWIPLKKSFNIKTDANV